ncbi:hypothetical protein [Streptomyces sp. NPDC056144]|uniref:hypothetical protein n=1 Tax=unclassified Streptomyces TaxID=2593676 RepID=UPI0035DC924F
MRTDAHDPDRNAGGTGREAAGEERRGRAHDDRDTTRRNDAGGHTAKRQRPGVGREEQTREHGG